MSDVSIRVGRSVDGPLCLVIDEEGEEETTVLVLEDDKALDLATKILVELQKPPPEMPLVLPN